MQGIFIFLTSTQPMVVSKEGAGSTDSMVLRPARSHVYSRGPDGINSVTKSGRTLINTVPSNVSDRVQFDTTNDLIITEIGDGAGSDGNPGVGFEDLNNNYAVAHKLTDFAIISPHSNTVVDVFYVTGTADSVSGKYVKYKTISSELATGTKENPGYYFENGAGTADQEGVDTSILGDDLVSWKFEGNKPFMLVFVMILAMMSKVFKVGILLELHQVMDHLYLLRVETLIGLGLASLHTYSLGVLIS